MKKVMNIEILVVLKIAMEMIAVATLSEFTMSMRATMHTGTSVQADIITSEEDETTPILLESLDGSPNNSIRGRKNATKMSSSLAK